VEKILDSKGNPIRNAAVEIWQCDNGGAYLHSKTGNAEKADKNFQGFGAVLSRVRRASNLFSDDQAGAVSGADRRMCISKLS